MKNPFRVGFAGLFLLVAAACGSSSETTETTTEAVVEASFPVTVGDLTLETQPERIVSLSPTATEMLYSIGAGAQVVAVDEYSNYPQEAVDLGTPLSGFEPNIEAISGYEPDLVIISYDPGSLVEQLGSLGIPVFTANAAMNLDGVYEQITQFGALTGQVSGAASLVEQMKADIDAAITGVTVEGSPTYYYELDNTYYSVTSDTFIGSTYTMLGLRNIADLAEGESYGYPQLSAEFILDKDPDLIFLACTIYCGETPESVAARPGWDTLTAVAQGNVVPLDDDTASRWGPRIVDHMATVVDAVERVLASGAE